MYIDLAFIFYYLLGYSHSNNRMYSNFMRRIKLAVYRLKYKENLSSECLGYREDTATCSKVSKVSWYIVEISSQAWKLVYLIIVTYLHLACYQKFKFKTYSICSSLLRSNQFSDDTLVSIWGKQKKRVCMAWLSFSSTSSIIWLNFPIVWLNCPIAWLAFHNY